MPAQQKKLEGSPQREEEEGFAFIDNSLTPFEGVLGSAYTGVPGR
jgi:iron only hydrogenase large subunit-like protein